MAFDLIIRGGTIVDGSGGPAFRADIAIGGDRILAIEDSLKGEAADRIIDAEGHRMELIVPDDKLSLAIGKKGQNVRLASQLTGWRIDIHSESKIYELERRAKEAAKGRAAPVRASLPV